MSVTFARHIKLLEQLQAGVHKSAQDLALALGVNVRSIRRYVEELRLQGYDIESSRGPKGGYRFKGNVYLPPMHFTDDEALALSYGLLLLKTSPGLAKASETTLNRLEPALPQRILDQTKALRDSVDVQAYQPLYNVPSQNLLRLCEAIREKQCVNLRYHPLDKAITSRDFDPYAVAHMIGLWFVAGYCHLRQDLRIFRVDRISKLELLDKSFNLPPDFDVIKFVGDGIARTNRGDRIEVVIDLEMSMQEAHKTMPPGRVIVQETRQGVRTTAFVKDFREVIGFLVSSSFNFTIIKPPELKKALKDHLLEVMRRLEHPG